MADREHANCIHAPICQGAFHPRNLGVLRGTNIDACHNSNLALHNEARVPTGEGDFKNKRRSSSSPLGELEWGEARDILGTACTERGTTFVCRSDQDCMG